jgi:hypothetical protein
MKNTTFFLLTMALFVAGDALALDDQLMPARRYGKWGFINKQGEWVISARYQGAHHFSEGVAGVQQYGKWGFIDHKGDWVIPAQFAQAKPFSEGLACAMTDQYWGYIDRTGRWAIAPQLRAISSFSDGLALVGEESGYVFIDQTGNRVIPAVFRRALPFAEGLAFVVQDNYRGYIDRRGHWMIRHEYDEAYSFSEGLALVRKDNRYGFIDLRGDLAIDCRYEDANFFREGLAAVKLGAFWGYIDQQGNVVIAPRFEAAHAFSEGYAVVKSDGQYGLVDSDGNWVLPPEYSGLSRHTTSISLQQQVREEVRQMFGLWQMKGEFEKTQDYLVRVSPETLQQHIDSLTILAMHALAETRVDFKGAQLGLYDADSESYHVIIPGANSIMLPVPIDEAPALRTGWHQVWLGNATYGIHGDYFVIRSLHARYGGRTFYYDRSAEYQKPAGVLPPVSTDDIIVNLPAAPAIATIPAQRAPSIFIGRSDVDTSIPVNAVHNENTFALIIGNEDYRRYQQGLQAASNVEFAEIDARIFSEYMIKTMGVPKDNVTLLVNATAGQMHRALAKMRALARAYDGKARLVFYYAGHGLPHPETEEPHLIPVDVHAEDLEYAIKLDDVYSELIEYESERVTVFLDACFTGGGRSEGLTAARGVRIKAKSPLVRGNLVVFSAAGGMRNAYPYREKAHGMFTYYILKSLQLSEGNIAYGDLADAVVKAVMRRSILINEREQEPEVHVSPVFDNTWRSFTFLPGDAGRVQGY